MSCTFHAYFVSLFSLGVEITNWSHDSISSVGTNASLLFASFFSTQRRMGALRRSLRGCSITRSVGRRSHPLSLSACSHLLTAVLSIAPHCFCASCSAALTAGVRGTITRYVTTIPSASATYHFYELDVAALDHDWLECNERRREWVDYAEAVRRVAWKDELAQGLMLSSLAPRR